MKLEKSNEMSEEESSRLSDLYRKTHRMCLFYLRNLEEAEDVAQDVFLKIAKNRGKFRGESQLTTWVWRICSNTLASYVHKKKLTSFLSMDYLFDNKNTAGLFSSISDDPEINLLKNETEMLTHKTYEKALNKLSGKEKRAFFLFYYEELSNREISNIMETSVSAVESLLVKCRRKLRKALKTI